MEKICLGFKTTKRCKAFYTTSVEAEWEPWQNEVTAELGLGLRGFACDVRETRTEREWK